MAQARSTNPDLFLARRAAKADPQAWDEIVDSYGGRIYNLALRFTGDASDAEDLTQDIFLKLYRRLDRYRGDVPLVAWALRLSRNLCIDHYRHHRTRKRAENVPEDVLRELPAISDPQRESQTRERRRLVQLELAEMSETLASVLMLRDFQGLSYEEIAAFLEVPIGTIKSRLNRGRRELVRRLESKLAPATPIAMEQSPC